MTPGLRTARDLDVPPHELDAAAEGLADRLFAGEPRGEVLRRVRTREAVRALGLGEDALREPRPALQRPPDPLDLDQVNSDAHGRII